MFVHHQHTPNCVVLISDCENISAGRCLHFACTFGRCYYFFGNALRICALISSLKDCLEIFSIFANLPMPRGRGRNHQWAFLGQRQFPFGNASIDVRFVTPQPLARVYRLSSFV